MFRPQGLKFLWFCVYQGRRGQGLGLADSGLRV